MSLFLPTAADAGLRNNTYPMTGNFYCLLLKSIPALSITTVSQLDLTNDPAYVSQELDENIVTSGAATEFYVNTAPIFPQLSTTDSFAGIAIARKAGANFAGTDLVYWVSSFRNFQTNEVSLPYQLDQASLEVRFPTTYLWSTNPSRFTFTSGPIDVSSPANFLAQSNDLLALLGTANKTITFANPIPSKVAVLAGTTAPTGTVTTIKDRAAAGLTFGTVGANIALDFGAGNSGRLIRPTALTLLYNNPTAVQATINVYATNALAAWSAAQIQSGAWTLIGSFSVNTIQSNAIATIPLSPFAYTPYLRIERQGVANAFLIQEIAIAGNLSAPISTL